MIKQDQIAQIIEPYISGTSLFLVKLSVGKDNLINVYIDSDNGVTIDDCVNLSRFIEQKLDRDSDDFELRVSSPGADEPFVNIRQYKKNIGRHLKLTMNDGSIKRGLLQSVHDDHITLKEEIKTKRKKQKTITTGDNISITFEDIADARVRIIF